MSEGEFFTGFVRLVSRPTGEWIAPPELRPRIVADAEAKGSNLTDVVNAILAKRYGVAYQVGGRTTAASPDGKELNLRMPMNLKRAVARVATENDRSLQDEIRLALADHYGLAMPAVAAA